MFVSIRYVRSQKYFTDSLQSLFFDINFVVLGVVNFLCYAPHTCILFGCETVHALLTLYLGNPLDLVLWHFKSEILVQSHHGNKSAVTVVWAFSTKGVNTKFHGLNKSNRKIHKI